MLLKIRCQKENEINYTDVSEIERIIKKILFECQREKYKGFSFEIIPRCDEQVTPIFRMFYMERTGDIFI